MRGISQQHLAETMNLKRNNIASYEAGIVEPRAVNFIELANFFNVSPDELLEEDIAASPTIIARVLRDSIPSEQRRPGSSIEQQLDLLEKQTTDMEKVVLGFQEFYRQRRKLGSSQDQTVQDFSADFEQLFVMLGQLLKANREFIANQRGN